MPWPRAMAGAKTSAVASAGRRLLWRYHQATASGEQPAIENAPGLKRGDRKDSAGMLRVIRQVHDERHDLRAGDRGQGAINAQVRDGVGVETGSLRQPTGQPYTREKRERD
jgi:hypothetical protein